MRCVVTGEGTEAVDVIAGGQTIASLTQLRKGWEPASSPSMYLRRSTVFASSLSMHFSSSHVCTGVNQHVAKPASAVALINPAVAGG